ncbi:uncharacterized protein LOC143239690 [Tachypleus tridentatus]|uniref:uncharacterized protein LOC143239690 n=1 Tax=Tachypleus tridentatus TaxID=6853 RepID=UPI003FD07215
MFCVGSHCFGFRGFQARQVEAEKPSAVDRIVPTIFPCVELRTDLSLQCTGFIPLKPSLAITKRTNLKAYHSSTGGMTDSQPAWALSVSLTVPLLSLVELSSSLELVGSVSKVTVLGSFRVGSN